MKTFKKSFLVATLGLLSLHSANAPADEQEILLALDISKSNSFISDQPVAKRAASQLADVIAGLSRKDIVKIRTVGDYGMRANPFRLDLVVSRKTPARKIADTVERLVGALPLLVTQGRIQASGTTQISAFLIDEARSLHCAGKKGQIYLLSDGIEASQSTDPDALLAGKAALPEPPENILSGCQLKMLGIGETANGANPAQTRNLIAAWEHWSNQAGADFVPKPVF